MTPDSALSVVPLPPCPGLYLIQGSHDLIPWALQSMTLAFSPKPIVWIDAANRFNAHWVSITARSICKDPAVVLSAFHIARPFTAYQLEAMITQKLLPAVRRYQAFFSVIADPLSLYEGAEGRDTQVWQSFCRFLQGVHDVAAQVPLVMLIPEPGPQRYFPELVEAATWRRRLQIVDQKHQLIEA